MHGTAPGTNPTTVTDLRASCQRRVCCHRTMADCVAGRNVSCLGITVDGRVMFLGPASADRAALHLSRVDVARSRLGVDQYENSSRGGLLRHILPYWFSLAHMQTEPATTFSGSTGADLSRHPTTAQYRTHE